MITGWKAARVGRTRWSTLPGPRMVQVQPREYVRLERDDGPALRVYVDSDELCGIYLDGRDLIVQPVSTRGNADDRDAVIDGLGSMRRMVQLLRDPQVRERAETLVSDLIKAVRAL